MDGIICKTFNCELFLYRSFFLNLNHLSVHMLCMHNVRTGISTFYDMTEKEKWLREVSPSLSSTTHSYNAHSNNRKKLHSEQDLYQYYLTEADFNVSNTKRSFFSVILHKTFCDKFNHRTDPVHTVCQIQVFSFCLLFPYLTTYPNLMLW